MLPEAHQDGGCASLPGDSSPGSSVHPHGLQDDGGDAKCVCTHVRVPHAPLPLCLTLLQLVAPHSAFLAGANLVGRPPGKFVCLRARRLVGQRGARVAGRSSPGSPWVFGCAEPLPAPDRVHQFPWPGGGSPKTGFRAPAGNDPFPYVSPFVKWHFSGPAEEMAFPAPVYIPQKHHFMRPAGPHGRRLPPKPITVPRRPPAGPRDGPPRPTPHP